MNTNNPDDDARKNKVIAGFDLGDLVEVRVLDNIKDIQDNYGDNVPMGNVPTYCGYIVSIDFRQLTLSNHDPLIRQFSGFAASVQEAYTHIAYESVYRIRHLLREDGE
jgi:hypothetical protein